MAQSGGSFLPNDPVTFTNTVTFTGTVVNSGTTTLTAPALSGAATGSGTFTYTDTLTGSAYAASTHYDEMYSKVTLTPTSTVTAANGLNAFRGELNLTAGKTVGDGGASYFTGVYGRVNFNTATVNIASGDLAAVYAKFDMGSTSTITSGHVAPLQANIVNPPATAVTTTDLIYAESASGTSIKSILSGYATAAYAFDLTDVSNAFISLTGTCTTPGSAHGWIRVLLNGSVRYIALSAAVS